MLVKDFASERGDVFSPTDASQNNRRLFAKRNGAVDDGRLTGTPPDKEKRHKKLRHSPNVGKFLKFWKIRIIRRNCKMSGNSSSTDEFPECQRSRACAQARDREVYNFPQIGKASFWWKTETKRVLQMAIRCQIWNQRGALVPKNPKRGSQDEFFFSQMIA